MHAAYGACPFLCAERDLLFPFHYMAASAAGLRRVLCRDFHVLFAVEHSLPAEEYEETPPGHIRDTVRQLMVPEHVLYLQVLGNDQILAFDQSFRLHLQVILPAPGYLPLEHCRAEPLFLIVGRLPILSSYISFKYRLFNVILFLNEPSI